MGTRNTKTLLLLIPLIMGSCSPTDRGEDLIADLAGEWFGYTTLGCILDLEISENGSTLGNYGSYYFTGQASLYGTRFELTSIDIDMEGQYNSGSESLEGELYDYRDPEGTVSDGFILRRVKK
ncbi:hypothetical protein KAU45_10065 [bacterium]|nr:hypothetical protein [bacterium]